MAPFWNPELQELWNTRCKSNSVYASYICNSKSPQQLRQKQSLLKYFKLAQNAFDKKFRQIKRQYSNKSYHDLADLAKKASSNPTEMWKWLKALSDKKPADILLEIIRDDGSISKDIKDVLSKWHHEVLDAIDRSKHGK